jgi:CheY-like chemotaxis protein
VTTENTALVKPDGKPVRALVVDDEPAISELVSMALRYEKFEVRTAASGHAAVAEAKDFNPDIIVLDIMLPDFDGLEVMRRIRADNADVPVLFLTAKDAVADRVVGLTAGGDDYVTKPFSVEELVARIRGIVRRSILASEVREDPEIVVGDLVLNEETWEVFRGGDRSRTRSPRNLSSGHFVNLVDHALNNHVNGQVDAFGLQKLSCVGQTVANEGETVGLGPCATELFDKALLGQ